MELSPAQWRTLRAACDTLIPAAPAGPAASGLGVPEQLLEALAAAGRPADLAGDGSDWPRVDKFTAGLECLDTRPNRLAVFSAHQMGTCRLGASPRTAVADPRGQVHGVPGLYICDASGFPSAAGVNPMITVMSLATWISRQIA